jgi:hypothetical protein
VTDADLSPDPGFTSYQQDFFRRFVGELHPGSAHVLVAPPGTGKSFVVAAAIAAMLRVDRITRVLVLAPAAIAEHWADLLKRHNSPCVVLDARQFRLIKESCGGTGVGVDWPRGVSAMSVYLANRQDIRDVVAAVPWDLVVVDEAHVLHGQQPALVESLIQRSPAPALLMTTSTIARNMHELAASAVTIDWTGAAVAQHRAELDQRLLLRETLSYRRSDEELALAQRVLDCARQLDRLTGALLLKRAASSINALEETLIRLAQGDSNERRGPAEQLLGLVEQTRSDARLEAYKGLVHRLAERSTKHTVAFCEYRATVSYVAAAIENLDYPTRVLDGGVTGWQRERVLAEFASQGGLLITTGAGSAGASWNFIEAAIHFDLPVSAAAFVRRESCYQRYGAALPCTTYFFVDESRAMPLEDLLYRMVQKVEVARTELGIDYEEAVKAMLS